MPPVILEDDRESIPDDAYVYRRLSWKHVGNRNGYEPGDCARFTSNCFRDYPTDKAKALGYPRACMSVCYAGLVSAERALRDYDGYGLARIKAGDLRDLKRLDGTPCPQGIRLAATDDEPWHAVVFDLTNEFRKDPVCRLIAHIAQWEIPLRNV